MPFTSLGLVPSLAQAAADLGFTAPTPVQTDAIPAVLAGGDLLATAQTGSGKTAAYALPLLQRWLAGPAHTPRRVRALVLVPTRELAAQVGEVLRLLAEKLAPRPKLIVAFGGVSINPQLMALRGGADVVVATPGRLLDLVEHNALKLGAVELLVLDEADRLLDLGFADELARVLALLPAKRQNLFFSATFPPAVETLARELLHEPLRVDVPSPTQDEAPVVLQRAIAVDDKRRTQLLRQLIKDNGWQRVLVFVATQYAAERLAGKLHHGEIFATSFHGGLSQGARQQTLKEFKEKRWDVVVTTDLAARGLHIDQLPVVVNYDLPRSAVDHVHRIGRTGRAGESGLAVSFVTAATLAHWQLIEKRQGMSLPLEHIAGFEPTDPAPPAEAGTGGIKGKRPSKKDKLRAAAAAQKGED
ncbi:DEAD/DEAH box helicase [Hydrogenophaga sp. SL48]|uniref:DEAD/DEAH box helicase n=1 Tax=Hydrogenophaga sp. SL48 TaxID=2806347 RepID=UPI001F025128|nr:DEAD/DEAH box helicase [Hydrogenophaga sp. SL48]UJW82950.1 DEAD/DEAH box helicase [Hydrogenophaga sp. SL48]